MSRVIGRLEQLFKGIRDAKVAMMRLTMAEVLDALRVAQSNLPADSELRNMHDSYLQVVFYRIAGQCGRIVVAWATATFFSHVRAWVLALVLALLIPTVVIDSVATALIAVLASVVASVFLAKFSSDQDNEDEDETEGGEDENGRGRRHGEPIYTVGSVKVTAKPHSDYSIERFHREYRRPVRERRLHVACLILVLLLSSSPFLGANLLVGITAEPGNSRSYWLSLIFFGLLIYVISRTAYVTILSISRVRIRNRLFASTDVATAACLAVAAKYLGRFPAKGAGSDLESALLAIGGSADLLRVRKPACGLKLDSLEEAQFVQRMKSAANALKTWRLRVLIESNLERRVTQQSLGECAIGLATLQYSYLPTTDERMIPIKVRLARFGKSALALSTGLVPLAAISLAKQLGIGPSDILDKLLPLALGVAAVTVLSALNRNFPERLALSRGLLNDITGQDKQG